MYRILLVLTLFLIFINASSQCDCEKIQRSDGIVITCKTLPVSGDNNLQIGLALATNGLNKFITATIRFLSETKLKIIGDLSLRLVDNNLLTFKLVKTQGSYIGDSNVEHGIFNIDDAQFLKIQKSNILTLTILLSDNRLHTLDAKLNQELLTSQAKCIDIYKTASNPISNRNVSTTTSAKQENSPSASKSTSPQSNWIEIKGEVGNFFASFPNKPTYTSGSTNGWRATDKEGQVIYLLSYFEAPPSGQMSITAAEKYLLPSMFSGNIQVSKSYTTYNGNDALDFLYKTTNNPTMYKQGRIVVRGQKVYIFQIHYYHKDLINFDKFTKSLRFY